MILLNFEESEQILPEIAKLKIKQVNPNKGGPENENGMARFLTRNKGKQEWSLNFFK